MGKEIVKLSELDSFGRDENHAEQVLRLLLEAVSKLTQVR